MSSAMPSDKAAEEREHTSDWIEISVLCDGEGAEAVGELFNRPAPSGLYAQANESPGGASGTGAVVELSGFDSLGELTSPTYTVRTYLSNTEFGRAQLRRLEEGLYHLGRLHNIPDPTIQVLAETDWAEAWKAHYRPQRLGERLLITPSWLNPETTSDDIVIRLDPGMAFGSGLHPSTRLCLRLLERVMGAQAYGSRPHVLDVGCGSGILSIAAALMGAESVLSTDIDPVAVRVASENVSLNGVDSVVQVLEQSLPSSNDGTAGEKTAASGGESTGWDLVLVNILVGVILSLLNEGLDSTLAPGGRMILSGVIYKHEQDLLEALSRHGLRPIDRLEEGDWLAFVVERAC